MAPAPGPSARALPAASSAPPAASATSAPVAATTWYAVAGMRESGRRPLLYHEAHGVIGATRDLRIQGDELVEADLTSSEKPPPRQLGAFDRLQGPFPEQAWGVEEMAGPGDEVGVAFYRYRKQGWVWTKGFSSAEVPRVTGVAIGPGDRALTLVRKPSDETYSFHLLSGKKGDKLPRLGLTKGDRPLALAGLPTGEVFLAFSRDDDKVYVDRWAPGAEQAERSVVPDAAVEGPLRHKLHMLLARGPNEAYLAGGDGYAKISRFDGQRWTSLGLPPEHGLQSYDVSPEGDVWAVEDGPESREHPGQRQFSLWKRPAGKDAWQRIELGRVFLGGSAEAVPCDVMALAGGAVYVLADLTFDDGRRTVALLRERPPRGRTTDL
ncbi:MAG: hypothetical protein U0359_38275 [Byssovorax sp.]